MNVVDKRKYLSEGKLFTKSGAVNEIVNVLFPSEYRTTR